MAEDTRIEFLAEVVRVKTMADGGLRFEFGIGEQYIMQAAQLMECKRAGVVLKVVVEPFNDKPEEKAGRYGL